MLQRHNLFILLIASAFFNGRRPFIMADQNLTTVVVCEGQLASLHCPAQHEIEVRHANFGRFSIHPCNDHMSQDLDTNCFNAHTIDVLRASCNHYQDCNIEVHVAVFGDVCPGNSNYLEARYVCLPGKATTTTSTTTTSTSTTTTSAVALPYEGLGPFDGGGTSSKIEGSFSGCTSRDARNLRWPVTALGTTARLQCPAGARGHAEWHCSSSAKTWMPAEGPNLSRCVSEWAQQLLEDLEDETGLDSSREQSTAWLELLRETHASVRRNAPLNGGDIRVAVELLASVLDKTRAQMAMQVGMLDGRAERHRETLELAQQIIDTIGHLLRANQRPGWHDLGPDQRQLLANQLLHQIVPQTLALLLPLPGWPSSGGSEGLLSEPTLVAEVAQASIYDYVPFPSMSLYRQNFDTVLLPREALQIYGQELANVFYIAWDPVLGDWLLGNQKRNNSQPHLRSATISKLISIAVVPLNGKLIGPRQQRVTMPRPILLTFRNDPLMRQIGQIVNGPRCVWWDADALNFISDDDACTLAERNATHTVCECRRMNTHFAVVADFESAPEHNDANGLNQGLLLSSTLIYGFFRFGALVSAICAAGALAACLMYLKPVRTKGQAIMYAMAGGGQRPRARCHVVAQMLIIQLILLNAFRQDEQQQYICTTMAFLLQYLALAFCCCTLMDALQLHAAANRLQQSANKVATGGWLAMDNSLVVHVQLYLFGYIVPLMFVLLALLFQNVPQQPEPPQEFCWLRPDNFGLTTFVTPMVFCLLATVTCLMCTVITVNTNKSLAIKNCDNNKMSLPPNINFHHAFRDADIPAEQRVRRAQVRQRLRWACARALLTSAACSAALGWVYFGRNTEPNGLDMLLNILTIVLFAVLNALVGVELLAEMVADKKIRIYYRRWRLNGGGIGHGSCLIRAIDKLCCCKASNGSKRNAPHPNRVPQLKLSYSPTGAQVALLHDANATGGSSTTTASSGGIKSACSDDVSSVTEMMMPSSAAESNVSMMVQQFSAQNCRNPPPALLMQLYQEHQRLSRNNSQSPQHAATTVDGTAPYYGKHMVNAENGEQAATYDYATIPYDELLLSQHQHNHHYCHQSPRNFIAARPITMPRLSQQQQQQISSGCGDLYSARGSAASGDLLYSARRTPQLMRVLQAHSQPPQVQLIHPDLHPQFSDLANYHLHRRMGSEEFGLPHNTAPPNFPPPPLPAPMLYGTGSGMDPVLFRHASTRSSDSNTSGTPRGSGTMLLRMDLSRPEPVFVDNVQEEEEEEELEEVEPGIEDGSGSFQN